MTVTATAPLAFLRYRRQYAEWLAIYEHLLRERPRVTAREVTEIQKRRLIARGEKKITIADLRDAATIAGRPDGQRGRLLR